MENRRNSGSQFLKNGIVKNENVMGILLKTKRSSSYFQQLNINVAGRKMIPSKCPRSNSWSIVLN